MLINTLKAFYVCFCVRPAIPISQPVLAAAPFNWSKVLAGRKHVPGFLTEFTAAATSAAVPGTAGTRQPVASGLYGLDREERKKRLMQEVSGLVSNLLGNGKCVDEMAQ